MPTEAKGAGLLDRVRRIALALPETEESSRLGGSPHFYVRGKIFAGCGGQSFGVKVGLELQSLLVERPGFRVAKYVGRYGWIDVDGDAVDGDDELRRLVELSYDLIEAKAPGGRSGGRGRSGGAARKRAKK